MAEQVAAACALGSPRHQPGWCPCRRMRARPARSAALTVEAGEGHAALVVDHSLHVSLGLGQGQVLQHAGGLARVLEVHPQVGAAGLHTKGGKGGHAAQGSVTSKRAQRARLAVCSAKSVAVGTAACCVRVHAVKGPRNEVACRRTAAPASWAEPRHWQPPPLHRPGEHLGGLGLVVSAPSVARHCACSSRAEQRRK